MAGRRTNLALLGALVGALLTGGLAFTAGTGWGRPVVIAHGLFGLCAVVLAPWKSAIARRGLGKRRKGIRSSLILSGLVLISLLFGIGHSMGLQDLPLSSMQLHVGAAVLAVPFALSHLIRRSTPLRTTDLSRRNLLRGAGVLAGGGLLYLTLEAISKAASFRGADRRFTGSHQIGSHNPGQMPVTQWFNDRVPSIEVDGWTIAVQGQPWTYDRLVDLQQDVTATLDCTGGWYSEQRWAGVPLSALLPETAARSVVVTSTTGYSRRFPAKDIGNLLLATAVGGAALSPGHGFPARLVAPGRRGFWWVKWVEDIRLSNRPWWLQLPLPAE
ncbi:MAG: molybdopterin-dependent oxidoreductase [Actinomycetota bacterium]